MRKLSSSHKALGRQGLLVGGITQGMANSPHGDVFLVVRQLSLSPHACPYTIPADAKPSFWRKYEFPTLERNTAITLAIKINNAAFYDRQAGWPPNDPNHLKLPPSDADSQGKSLALLL